MTVVSSSTKSGGLSFLRGRRTAGRNFTFSFNVGRKHREESVRSRRWRSGAFVQCDSWTKTQTSNGKGAHEKGRSMRSSAGAASCPDKGSREARGRVAARPRGRSTYLGSQLAGVRSTSHAANSRMGTGRGPGAPPDSARILSDMRHRAQPDAHWRDRERGARASAPKRTCARDT